MLLGGDGVDTVDYIGDIHLQRISKAFKGRYIWQGTSGRYHLGLDAIQGQKKIYYIRHAGVNDFFGGAIELPVCE